jgi:hypothetical protein
LQVFDYPICVNGTFLSIYLFKTVHSIVYLQLIYNKKMGVGRN